MVDNKIIINRYSKLHYSTIFNQVNGLLLRIEDKGYEEPFWCSSGPELLDISITNWCDNRCGFCYKKSSIYGKHLSITDFDIILNQAAQMKILQVALGGGNPNQHPDFCEMLKLTRDYNIVPSYTTNGKGLTEEVLASSYKYCGAVAVSAYQPFQETKKAISLLIDHGIRANIHFLLTTNTIDQAINWLQSPPDFFEFINAIIFLNYKPISRMPSRYGLLKNSPKVPVFFDLVNNRHPFKIGFDSCSISGLAKFLKVNQISIESCEAGRFSMYISEDMKMYPCSFMIDMVEGIPITKNNIQKEWIFNDIFIKHRTLLSNPNCTNCEVINVCSGGCPVFPEINICS